MKLALALFCVGVVALIAAPFAIGFAIERTFQAQGAERVSYQDIDFNPFVGTLTIEGLFVSRDKLRVLHLGRASANFAWSGLLGKRIRFQSLLVERADVRVDRVGEAGLTAAGIVLRRAEGIEDVDEPAGEPALDFGVDRLEIVDSRVRYQDPAVQSVLQIDRAVLTRLATWDGRSQARLDLSGRWNDGQVTIEADFDAFASPPRADAHVLLEGLSLEPWSPLLPLEGATMQGRLWLDLDSQLVDDDGRMRLREQGTLRIEQPRLSSPEGVFAAESAELSTTSESLPFVSPQQVTLEAELKLAEVAVETQPGEAQAREIAWTGRVDVGASEGDGDPRVAGLIRINGLNVDANGTRIAGESVAWDGRVELEASGPAVEGELELKRVELDTAEARGAIGAVAWRGDLRLDAQGPALGGVLELEQLSLEAPRPRIMVASDGARWEGRARLVQDQPIVDGDLEVRTLRVDDSARRLRLADIGRLGLQAIDLQGLARLDIARSELDDLRLVQPLADPEARPLVDAKGFQAVDLTVEDMEAVSIDTISVDGMTALVRRESDRRLYMVHDLTTAGEEQRSESPAQPAEPDDVPQVRINRIELGGGSAILLEDESVAPVFRTRLPIVEATVTNIDSTRPDQSSEFKLRLAGKYSQMTATGSSKLLSTRPTLSVEGQIKSLELPPLSPFTVQSSGYAIRGGRADVDLQLSVVEGQMDGETDLVLHNVTVAAQEEARAKDVDQKLSMPLNLALSVLKDKNDDIKMTVPISGDIRDPGFSFRGAFNQAMIKATRLASLQYLQLALGPYGALVTLAQVGGTVVSEAASYVRLKPVIFLPGKEETESPERDYGEHLGKVLRDRPGLELQVCGVYVAADMAALQFPQEPDKLTPAQLEQLTNLASNRSARVKDYMVNEEGIEPERLFVCNPRFDPAADAQPRVELGI